jgi:hypothetical protein
MSKDTETTATMNNPEPNAAGKDDKTLVSLLTQPKNKPEPPPAPQPPTEPKPEPPTAQPPSESKTNDDVTMPPNPKKADWNRAIQAAMERGRKKAAAEVEELKKKLAEAEQKKSTPANDEEVRRLKEELAAAKKQLAEFGLVTSPEYQEFKQRKTSVLDKLKSQIGDELFNDIQSILQLPPGKKRDEALEERLESETSLTISRIDRALEQLDEMTAQETAIRSDPEKALTLIQEKRAAQMAAAKRAAEQAFESALLDFREHPAYMKTNHPEYDATVDQRLSEARQIAINIESLPPVERARMALAAKSTDYLEDIVRVLLEDKARLEEQIKSLQAATPKAEGRSEAAGSDKKGFVEILLDGVK